MKKSLARTICLTLFCSAFAATGAHALEVTGDTTLTSDLTEGLVISGSSPININVAGSGNGLQVFAPDGISIINRAKKAAFTGDALMLGGGGNAIRNTNGSSLTFDNDISVECNGNVAIYEIDNEGELTINGIYNGGNYYERHGLITNSGSFTFNGERFHAPSSVINNDAGGEMLFSGSKMEFPGINNYGNITVANKSSRIEILGKIKNQGKMVFEGPVNTYFVSGDDTSVVNDADGEIEFKAGVDTGGDIENRGRLRITYKNRPAVSDYGTYVQCIMGDIKHFEGAKTDIVLSGIYSGLYGNIIGSNSDFHLSLENNAFWLPNKQEGVVDEITLNGGEILLDYNNCYGNDGEPIPWSNDYDSLKLKNFKSSGEELLSLATDLKNNAGDQYNFVGTTPKETLNLFIVNKDGNGGVPIKKEDGYSVTVVTAPGDSEMKVDAALSIYKSDHVSYFPIIEEVTADNLKKWNFVGWREGGKKDALPQNEDGHEINDKDVRK